MDHNETVDTGITRGVVGVIAVAAVVEILASLVFASIGTALLWNSVGGSTQTLIGDFTHFAQGPLSQIIILDFAQSVLTTGTIAYPVMAVFLGISYAISVAVVAWIIVVGKKFA